jgi:FkbM family methyltransferase
MNTKQGEGLATLSPPRPLYKLFHVVLAWLDRLGWVPSGVTTYLGHPFVYPLDSGIGRQIASGEEWDAILGTIIPTFLPMDEPSICEVGSNIGASLLQITRVKPRARILAFEPSERFRPFLERNLRLAGINRVEVSSFLLGRQQDIVWLYNNNSSASVTLRYDHGPRGQRKGPRRRQSATMTTLDEVFHQRPRVDFIKVDTDGFDLEVIRGAEETLKRDSPILYFELFPAACQISALAADMNWLQSIGYGRFICFTSAGKLLGVTDKVEQAIAWANANNYCDILVFRKGSPLETQIESLVAEIVRPKEVEDRLHLLDQR